MSGEIFLDKNDEQDDVEFNRTPKHSVSLKPRPGDWLEPLRAVEYLGNGCFGIVVKAAPEPYDVNSSTATAVKLMFPTYPSDPLKKSMEKTARFREFELLAEKSHTNVVKSLNFVNKKFSADEIERLMNPTVVSYSDEVDEELEKFMNRSKRQNGIEGICIQMELCGPSLRCWLNDDRNIRKVGQPDPFRIQIGQGIISGLKFLHQEEILHRDLKPENIYFSICTKIGSSKYSLPIKIGDFGLSRDIEGDKSQTLTVDKGTRLYRAPEVDTGKYGKQADYYSLGLILYELFESIPYKELSTRFAELVFGRRAHKVEYNVYVTNLRNLIIRLTKSRKEDRLKPGTEIDFRYGQGLLTVSTTSAESGYSHPGVSESTSSTESTGLC